MKRTIGIIAGLVAFSALLFWYGDVMREEMRVCFEIGERIFASPPAFNSEYPPFISSVFGLMAIGGRDGFTWAWTGLLFFSAAGIATYGWYALRDSLSVLFPIVAALTVPALGATLVLGRFDILLFFATFIAWRAFEKDRMVVSGFFLAVAVAIKLVPMLLLPLFVVMAPPSRRKLLIAGFAAGGLACSVLALMVLGLAGFYENLTYMLAYHSHRGVQVESLWAGVYLAYQELTGGHPGIAYTYGAYHLNDIPSWFPRIATACTLAGVALLTWRGWMLRREKSVFAAHLIAIILWSFAASTVLSPQYFVWVMPLIALFLWEERRSIRTLSWIATAALTVAVATVTHWLYPGHYDRLLGLFHDAIVFLNIRNALLPTLVMLLVWKPFAVRAVPKA